MVAALVTSATVIWQVSKGNDLKKEFKQEIKGSEMRLKNKIETVRAHLRGRLGKCICEPLWKQGHNEQVGEGYREVCHVRRCSLLSEEMIV